MTLDIQHRTIELPQFTVVSRARHRAAAEFMKLCRCVMDDESARIEIEDTSRTAYVPYADGEEVALRAVYWKSVQMADEPQISYLSLGVVEPRGAMLYSVESQKLPYIELATDPFAQGILEYFRTQYN